MGLHLRASSSRVVALRRCSRQRRLVCRIALVALALTAGVKLINPSGSCRQASSAGKSGSNGEVSWVLSSSITAPCLLYRSQSEGFSAKAMTGKGAEYYSTPARLSDEVQRPVISATSEHLLHRVFQLLAMGCTKV